MNRKQTLKKQNELIAEGIPKHIIFYFETKKGGGWQLTEERIKEIRNYAKIFKECKKTAKEIFVITGFDIYSKSQQAGFVAVRKATAKYFFYEGLNVTDTARILRKNHTSIMHYRDTPDTFLEEAVKEKLFNKLKCQHNYCVAFGNRVERGSSEKPNNWKGKKWL